MIANLAITLIHQCDVLIRGLIEWKKRDFLERGGILHYPIKPITHRSILLPGTDVDVIERHGAEGADEGAGQTAVGESTGRMGTGRKRWTSTPQVPHKYRTNCIQRTPIS